MQEKEIEKNQNMVDILTEAPIQFTIKGKDMEETFNIYPKTLGMRLLIDNLKEQLGIIPENIRLNPLLECMRVCKSSEDLVLRMLAYSTLQRKAQIQDAETVNRIMAFFKENMGLDDMGTLLLHILKDESITIAQFKADFGIDKELDRKKAIMEAKTDSKNNVSYGGVTVYGTLLSFFAEKYGWTIDYIMWGISYVNLMLLYSDHADSIYLTDEELGKLPFDIRVHKGDMFDASDPANAQQILTAMANRGLNVSGEVPNTNPE